MLASLLYYRKFVKSLTDIGFELNPYNPCIANKMIEGSQATVCFHMDDCKLSHLKSWVNDKIIKYLCQKYESIFEDGSGKMKVSRGKIHSYLGMMLDYTVCVPCHRLASGLPKPGIPIPGRGHRQPRPRDSEGYPRRDVAGMVNTTRPLYKAKATTYMSPPSI